MQIWAYVTQRMVVPLIEIENHEKEMFFKEEEDEVGL